MKKRILCLVILLLGILSCVVFVGCKSPKVLPTPQNLEFINRLLSWDKVEGAIGYTVFVNEQEYETADTSFAVVDITAGNYTLGVMAIGDGDKYTNSQIESIPYELLPAPQELEDETGFYYKLLEDGTGYEVSRGANKALINHPHIVGDITISDFFGDYPVKRIADDAFYLFKQEGYEPRTGSYCNTVTTGVELPKYLESIGVTAFKGCIALKEIYIPDGVLIESAAFSDCISLKTVRLPSDLKKIPMGAFQNTALDNIELPQTLEVIGSQAFCVDKKYSETAKTLSSIVIPASVKSIGASAFSGRENLRDITILSTELEYFGIAVFADTAWEQAQPDGLTYLREDILYCYKGEMPADTTLTIPSEVKYIAGGAFGSFLTPKPNLKKIVLPDGVKLLGENTFANCTALEEIVWQPKDLTSLPDGTFQYCTSLRDVSFVLNVFEGEHLDSIFMSCKALEEVTVPAGVKTMQGTFYSCTGLKKVNLPEGLERLDRITFKDCTSLKEITLPSTLKFIGESAFDGSGLVSIILPKSLEKMETYGSCKDLKAIYYEGTYEQFKKIAPSPQYLSYNAPILYYYSESEPTTVGNYWRYVDGQAVAWQTTTETTALQQKATQYTFVQLPAVVKKEN